MRGDGSGGDTAALPLPVGDMLLILGSERLR
jgi:hypothetical protein